MHENRVIKSLLAWVLVFMGSCAQYSSEPALLGLLLQAPANFSLISILETNSTSAVTEGTTTDSYSVVLNSAPTSDVTVSIAFDTSQIQVNTSSTSPQTLTFSSSNWNTAQTVNVTPVDDIIIESTKSIVNSHTSSSADERFNNISVDSVNISVADNDAVGASTSSTGTTYANVGSASFTPASTSDVWLWFATFAIKNNMAQTNSSETNLVRITLNGTTDTEVEQQNNEGDHFRILVVAGRVTGTTSTQTIALDAKAANAGETVTVKNVRIVSFKLPIGADFQYAGNDSIQSLKQAWTDIAGPQLTFSPASAGDYFIIATGQHHENPESDNSELRFVESGGTFWPQNDGSGNYSKNGRGAYDTFFVIRKVTLTTGSKTFKYQFQSSGSGVDVGGSQVKGLRIFAFRADAFEAVESVENLAASSTDTTQVVKSTLTTAAPAATRDYLIFQNMYVYDNDSSTTHQTAADFRIDASTIADQDHVINRGLEYQFASACIQTLNTSAAHTFENRFWSNNATLTYAKESVIYVLRFNP